jgi:putative protein-disulfide isomerase
MTSGPFNVDDIELIYVHDPMCSWCWAFRSRFQELQEHLPRGIKVTRLLGGLAPDSDRPMPYPLQCRLQGTWRRIEQSVAGTRFNHDFWTRCQPRRSTWPACRAVIAARELDPELEPTMIEAIQRAYYLEARNPSDADTLISLAQTLGLDGRQFGALLNAPETHAVLGEEIARARSIGADRFPSLRLQIARSSWPIPVDYGERRSMLDAIRQLIDQNSADHAGR